MSRFFVLTLSLLAILLIAPTAHAAEGIITKPSNYDAKTTLDRLQSILSEKGITVFARIDHAAGAAGINQELSPTEVLIFGNPAMGTPLMQSNRTIAIDLPLKVLAWTDADGNTWLTYNQADDLKRRHQIKDRDKVFAKMQAVLDNLTTQATK